MFIAGNNNNKGIYDEQSQRISAVRGTGGSEGEDGADKPHNGHTGLPLVLDKDGLQHQR